MSISYRDGDIFHEQDLNGIAHQTNTRGVFGGGIARTIRELHPKVHQASEKACKGKTEAEVLGNYDVVPVPKNAEGDPLYFFNVYSQSGLGGEERNTRYDILVNTLTEICDRIEARGLPFTLGVPYGFGCGLAKGSWTIVEAIFKSVFEDSQIIDLVIVKNPKFADTVKK